MMNEPQFKIHGLERRKLKKQLANVKSFVKDFWHYHQMDKDLASFYGSSSTFPMSDHQANDIYKKKKEEIKNLEVLLAETYSS